VIRYFAVSVLFLTSVATAQILSPPVDIPITITNPGGTCPQGSSLGDGCPNAPIATIQYPNLLTVSQGSNSHPICSGRGTSAPGFVIIQSTGAASATNCQPWNVAGVDYSVGIPTGTTLTDWRTAFATCISGGSCTVGGASWTYNSSSIFLQCTSGNAVLTAIDWTFTQSGSPGNIYHTGGCASITLDKNKIGCQASSSSGALSWFVHDQGGTNLTITNSTLDFSPCSSVGANCQTVGQPGLSIITQTNGSLVMKYNWLAHYCDHTYEQIGTANSTGVTIQYNLLDDPNNGLASSAHMNWSQFGQNNGPTTISYNTEYMYQSPTAGNEGYQLYSNGLSTQATPMTISNNTMLDTSGEMCAGYHGTTSSDFPTHVSGSSPLLNQNNYFGATSGAVASCNAALGFYIFYYPNSFSSTPLSGDLVGWTNSGNVDMSTGGTVTP
jgi:hypothetical protein